MDDKTMLELAAYAAGLNVKAERVDSDDEFICLVVGEKFTREKIEWNSLASYEDAMNLRDKLNLHLELPKYKGFGTTCENVTVFRDDPKEQACRAITMAAAERGKFKKDNELANLTKL